MLDKGNVKIVRAGERNSKSNNRIRNTKYTTLSFIPLVALQQFKSFSSTYFFLIMMTQTIKIFAITSFATSFLPWLFVLIISFINEGVDDYKRYLRDVESNSTNYSVFRKGKHEKIQSADIKEGDLLIIKKGEKVPADCILIKSEDPSGEVFLRTDQLDGETDWKRRLVPGEVQNCNLGALHTISATVEKPNKEIYNFSGTLSINNAPKAPNNNFVFNPDDADRDESVREGVADHGRSVATESQKDNKSVATESQNGNKSVVNDSQKDNKSVANDSKSVGNKSVDNDSKFVGSRSVDNANQSEHPVTAKENELKAIDYAGRPLKFIDEDKAPLKGSEEDIGTLKAIDERKRTLKTVSDRKRPETGDGRPNASPGDERLSISAGDEKLSVSLDLDNTVWANTIIATTNVLGLVIYTGHKTRSMMNTYKPRCKLGRLDVEIDHIVALLGTTSAIAAVIFTIFRNPTNLRDLCIVAARYLILFSYVIPISLKVTINLARMSYIKLVQNPNMTQGVIVRSSIIQEELGRVSYLLSDKTGTLTKNEMIMKKIHLGTICYMTENNEEINDAVKNVLKKDINDNSVFKKQRTLEEKIFELIEAMSVCHNVTPVISDNELLYQASSPDEIAIVQFTESAGLKLIRRDRDTILIETPSGEITYRIHCIFPFTSETKRMGILVEREGDKKGNVMFLEKGADTVMKTIVKDNDWMEEETDNMARDGLRTLLIGKKVLTKDEFKDFMKKYTEARLSMVDRAAKVFETQKLLEKNLELLGLTGVEDKLQDNVKPTLEKLRNAGIKIWMLTGDKIETAISIAMSSKLLNRMDTYIVIANLTSAEQVKKKLLKVKTGDYTALVIDGVSLVVVIEHLLNEFIAISKNLNCLIGCRYSPTQKAVMVEALKKRTGEIVCCIGDGGNDVSMITEANVGIGIEGKEGNQASLAADFSVKKFADICDLLFWHGRRCYKNTSMIAQVIIHRGTLISVIQGIFCALIGFIPVSIFRGSMLAVFTTCTFPTLLALIIFEDIPKNISMKFPELYKELRTSNIFSVKSFLVSNLNSFFQGSVIMLIFFYFFPEMYSLSLLVFTELMINEQLLICLMNDRLPLTVVLSCCITMSLYFVMFFILEEMKMGKISDKLLHLLFVSLVAISFKAATLVYKKWFRPASYIKLRMASV